MPTPESSASTSQEAQNALVARHAARLDACWPLVHVDSVEIIPGPGSERIRAVVQLGGLVPADVRVEVVSPVVGPVSSMAVHERMSCDHALGNGAFVFESTLSPSAHAGPTEWLIHVHPAEAREEPRVERHFSRAGRAAPP